jgi:hypothetical protein
VYRNYDRAIVSDAERYAFASLLWEEKAANEFKFVHALDSRTSQRLSP